MLIIHNALAESVRETPVVAVVKQWSPSVVNISTERVLFLRQHPDWGAYGGALDEFSKNSPGTVIGTIKGKGIGSGVVVSPDGLIVTNAHVVQMANKVFVILYDGTACAATTVAISPQNDLALLQIQPPRPLQEVSFADDVMVGETVVSIGNPFGLEHSVSAGIISGANRSLVISPTRTMTGLLQTDASINPGSSGGALFNLEGKLAGVNLAVVQNAQSIGFAIPARTVKEIIATYYTIKDRRGVRGPANQ